MSVDDNLERRTAKNNITHVNKYKHFESIRIRKLFLLFVIKSSSLYHTKTNDFSRSLTAADKIEQE